MTIAIPCLVAILAIAFILFIRPQDLPAEQTQSPFAHLDERKAAIYENLRDLQFEYRLGKLSDDDYQHSKKDLQTELAGVLMEVDRINGVIAGAPKKAAAAQTPVAEKKVGPPFVCPVCNASFEKDLKFCGECGKPMKAAV